MKTQITQSCEDSTKNIILPLLSGCDYSETKKEKSGLAKYYEGFTAEFNSILDPVFESTSISDLVFISNTTQQVQLELQPKVNTTENEKSFELVSAESNNSNNSTSILIKSPEPQNQLNFEKEPIIYEDTSDNAVDTEWLPGNDDKLTSDDVTDAESLSGEQNLQNDTISHNGENEKVKKSRKRRADPSEWNDIKNKKRRECGESYQGWTKQKGAKAKRGAERPERKLELACTSDHCKKTRDCHKITELQREFMFNFFWKKMSWDQKKVYVASLVSNGTPKRRTT